MTAAKHIRGPVALRLNDAAALAGVSVGKLRKDIRDGLLEARKLGRCTVVLHDELERYVNSAPRLEPFNLRDKKTANWGKQ